MANFGGGLHKAAILQRGWRAHRGKRAMASMSRWRGDCQRGWLSIPVKFYACDQLIFVTSRPIVSVRLLEMEARLGSSCNRDMDQPELVGISTSALNE